MASPFLACTHSSDLPASTGVSFLNRPLEARECVRQADPMLVSRPCSSSPPSLIGSSRRTPQAIAKPSGDALMSKITLLTLASSSFSARTPFDRTRQAIRTGRIGPAWAEPPSRSVSVGFLLDALVGHGEVGLPAHAVVVGHLPG